VRNPYDRGQCAAPQKDHTATLEACRAAHVIVLTYAVNKPASLAYLRTNLLPSLRMAHVSVPMILVGCMQDTVAQEPQSQSLESEIGTPARGVRKRVAGGGGLLVPPISERIGSSTQMTGTLKVPPTVSLTPVRSWPDARR
jgi:hypothetical protein